jgi:hypothetical protein
MANTSRLIIEAQIAPIAQLAGEALHRRQIGAALTFVCADAKPNRTVLKYAAEGASARIVAAQLPLFVTPQQLQAGLTNLGVSSDAADAVIGQLNAAMAIREEREQVSDAQACELFAAHLASVPSLAGLKTIRPTSEPAPAPPAEPAAGPPVFELPKGDGRRPPSRAAVDAARKEHEAAVAAFQAAAAGPPRHENQLPRAPIPSWTRPRRRTDMTDYTDNEGTPLPEGTEIFETDDGVRYTESTARPTSKLTTATSGTRAMSRPSPPGPSPPRPPPRPLRSASSASGSSRSGRRSCAPTSAPASRPNWRRKSRR